MAIWGWTPSYYVRTHLTPATRDIIGHFVLMPDPRSDRYRECFLDDMKRSMPRFFVDSTDEFHWQQWSPGDQCRYTMYPPLAEFVNHNYHLLASVVTDRRRLPVLIYVRNGPMG